MDEMKNHNTPGDSSLLIEVNSITWKNENKKTEKLTTLQMIEIDNLAAQTKENHTKLFKYFEKVLQ